MSESEMEGKDGIVNGDVEAARVRFENQRLTRRQALRKFGLTAGMAVFATLSIDDLARLAAKKLQETEMTKGIGDTLAKEFRDAGVALANHDGGDPYGDYEYMANVPCRPGEPCDDCCNRQRDARNRACNGNQYCLGQSGITWRKCTRKCLEE